MPLYAQGLRQIIPQLTKEHPRIRGIFRLILSAVQYAHERGIIHRDLNPNNIMMNCDNEIVVSDFGLGRRLDASTSRVTQPHGAMGTSGYMAPEQYHEAEHADVRSDIFALGVILNEMYSGTTWVGFCRRLFW